MSRIIALKAAADAIANIGVEEQGGENRGKFVGVYQASTGNRPGDPWCASMVYYRLITAAAFYDKALVGVPISGYTPDWKNQAVKSKKWLPVSQAKATPSKVRVGDLCLFYSSSKKRIFHIGIVIEVHSWGVVTVEGNTSAEPGVDADGDGVFRKVRSWSELGTGGGFFLLDQ